MYYITQYSICNNVMQCALQKLNPFKFTWFFNTLNKIIRQQKEINEALVAERKYQQTNWYVTGTDTGWMKNARWNLKKVNLHNTR
jgi:hypothetical protein